jgi:hypothetical protein
MTWRVAGINFDHMHMGDLLRLVHEHPDAEIAGSTTPTGADGDGDPHLRHPRGPRLHRPRRLHGAAKPDLAIVCAATAEHASHVERLAPHGVNVFVEKPFAASVDQARR